MNLAVPAPDDSAARRRIRTSLDESLIVEAAAGTGKTSELVHRIVAVLAAGRTKVGGIVAVTFTRKAAGELKLRLRQELDRARSRAAGTELSNLEDALAHLEEARIGTIHSFCAELLRERPVEARVDPAFEDLSESEAPRLYAAAFRDWIQRKLANPSEAMRRALSRVATLDDRSPIDALRRAGWQFLEFRDYSASWQRRPFDRDAAIDALVPRVLELADTSERCANPRHRLYLALAPVRTLAAWIRHADRGGATDRDALEGLLLKLLADLRKNDQKGEGRLYAPGLERAQVLAARDALVEALADFAVRAGADLAPLLQEELRDLAATYEEHKRRAGKLDFVDLLLRARDLVRGNAEVRAFLQRRFTHIFVDEFQDTDPLQAEILLLLAARDPEASHWLDAAPAPGKLFLVGDPKQSIYRFRRADVLLYQTVREALEARGVAVVHLTRSHRAVAAIQHAINAAFAPEMTGDAATGQPAYVPLADGRPAAPGQPSVVALPVPEPLGFGGVVRKNAIDASLPDAIAAYVEWLLQSGWTVTDPERPGERLPIAPRHIAVLFRRLVNRHSGGDVTHDFVRGLEARGIPHLLLGGRSFHQREEVETLRAALNAIEWPDDELSVYATLKGALFALRDEMLLRYRHEAGRLHPFQTAAAAGCEPAAEALEILAELHRARNRRPVVSTLSLLLERTRAHAGFALRFGGAQALTNVNRVCELARNYDAAGGGSFRGFVEELEALAEEGEAAVPPVLESGAEGVRVMSVHGAKGLEFPVVILADITAKLSSRLVDRSIDTRRNLCALRLLNCAPWELEETAAAEAARDRAEGIRVAYVAATRARDLLVVPAVREQPFDGWVGALNRAIYSKAALPDGRGSEEWVDLSKLRLKVPFAYGVRHETILSEGGAAAESVRQYEAWQAARADAAVRGGVPEFEVFTPAEADAPPPQAAAVAVEAVARAGERPSGRRFGTLVHAVLRDAGFDAAAVERFAALHGRMLGASPAEIAAAVEAAAAALSHEILARARRAERCHRELPLTLRLDERRVLEGVADLAFLEDGAWIVVDYKTDAELPAARYVRQLEWYAYALARIMGAPARGVLLSI